MERPLIDQGPFFYRDIKLEKGASVQFTAALVNIRNLTIEDSGEGNECHGSHSNSP